MRVVGGAICLALLTIATYAPTLRFGFVWDDHEQILQNQSIAPGAPLDELFTTDVLGTTRDGQRSNYYRPLFFLLLAGIQRLVGFDPIGWHAAAIATHVLATWSILALLLNVGLAQRIGLAAAALFAVHPVHGESVAWLSAAFNDPPATVFGALALALHARAARSGSQAPVVAAVLLAGVALLFKESALALLPLAAIIDWAAAREAPLRLRGARLLPWVLLVTAYLALRMAVLGAPLGRYDGDTGIAMLIATAPILLMHYVLFVVWPFDLAPSYSLRPAALWSFDSTLAALGCILAVILCVWAGRRRKELVPWLVWGPIAVLPALNIRDFRPEYVIHQRYLYLAVLGPCVVLALILAHPGSRTLLASASVIVLACLGLNWLHLPAWANDRMLWERIAAVDPGNAAAHDWLGTDALSRGEVTAARRHYEASLAIASDSVQGNCNMANLLHVHLRRPAEALEWYRAALHHPLHGDASVASCRIGYGVALAAVGESTLALQQLALAAEHPTHPPAAFSNAATILAAAQRPDQALEIVEQGLLHHPNDRWLASQRAGLAPLNQSK